MSVRPYTTIETIEIMLAETQNEITRTQVMLRLMERDELRANGGKGNLIAPFKSKINTLKQALADLEDFHSKELEKAPVPTDTK